MSHITDVQTIDQSYRENELNFYEYTLT